MGAFIISISFIHRRRQIKHIEKLNDLKGTYEKSLLTSQLEIQEQTFMHISREIHDNIGLSLTLAKLYLHTIPENEVLKNSEKLQRAIDLIGKSITELTNISQSLNAELIIQHGILRALEDELERIRKAGIFDLYYEVIGTPVYLDSNKELIIFRILQESLNNILKHAMPDKVYLKIIYLKDNLAISIIDNGRGFDVVSAENKKQSGLKNMNKRTQSLNGTMSVNSKIGGGTTLNFTIPYT